MATHMTLKIALLMVLFSSASPANQDISVAIAEMQRANYFSFVMLINMSPPDPRMSGNVTFLMPKDRMLSKTIIPQTAVSDFLLRHSISSPLLFEHFEHIPTGSILPSSLPDYILKISNGGRRSFSLNNVKIISPNICTAGSSIRCHGIDGVLQTNSPQNNTSSSCSTSSPHPSMPPLVSSPSSTPRLNDSAHHTPVTALPPSHPTHAQHSGSSKWLPNGRLLKFLVTILMVSTMEVSV